MPARASEIRAFKPGVGFIGESIATGCFKAHDARSSKDSEEQWEAWMPGCGIFRVMSWSVVVGGPAGGARRSMSWIERIKAGDSDIQMKLSQELGGQTKVSSLRGADMSIALGGVAELAKAWGACECVCIGEPYAAGSPRAQACANRSLSWALERRALQEGGGEPCWERRGLNESWVGPTGWARLEAMLGRESLSDACEMGKARASHQSL